MPEKRDEDSSKVEEGQLSSNASTLSVGMMKLMRGHGASESGIDCILKRLNK